MYWIKLSLFVMIGLMCALCSERVVKVDDAEIRANPLENVASVRMPLALLMLWACASRFVDFGSTSLALGNPGLRESAPGLGPFPSRATLFKLTLYQCALILAVGALTAILWVVAARVGLLTISFVGFAAASNNMILFFFAPAPPGERVGCVYSLYYIFKVLLIKVASFVFAVGVAGRAQECTLGAWGWKGWVILPVICCVIVASALREESAA